MKDSITIRLKSCVGTGYSRLINKNLEQLKQKNINLSEQNNIIMINNKLLNEYFNNNKFLIDIITFPIKLLELDNNNLRFSLKIHGGGISGQAKTARQLISYLLLKLDISHKEILNSFNLLTLDKRRRESQKIGLKGARRARQFTKR